MTLALLLCLLVLGAVLFVAGWLPDSWFRSPALKNYASPDDTQEVTR